MSDYDNDFEDFEGGEDNSPAGLRKALAKAKREAKAANERAEAAEKAAAEATRTVAKNTLTEVLKTKGLKPGLVRFLEKDGVEATPEAVDAWVKENGEFFNVQSTEQAEPKEQAQEQEQGQTATDLPPELVQAVQASQQLDASGVSPAEVGVLQRIQSVSTDPSKVSWDQMIADLKAAGVPTT